MSKVVIGLVGKQGSGKGSFVEQLRAVAPKISMEQIKSGGILIDLLKKINTPITRENLQNVADWLKNDVGPNSIAEAMVIRINKSQADVIIYDAIRWKCDVEVVRRYSKNVIVYINSDKDIRYERLKNRGEKENEHGLSREDFEKAELTSTEIEVDELGSRADFTILNNGSLDGLKGNISYFAVHYGLFNQNSQ